MKSLYFKKTIFMSLVSSVADAVAVADADLDADSDTDADADTS